MTEPTVLDVLDQRRTRPPGAAPGPDLRGQQGPGDSAQDQPPDLPIDRARYRRVVRYFAGVILSLFLWDVVLRSVLGHDFVQRSAERRWQKMARRFRLLAVDLGGVLIKLGQFLSVRVDVLPLAVTSDLAGLQDEVPPVSISEVRAVVEAEYGQSIGRVFRWFSPQPEAAASLAQVHDAQLLTGDRVMVKVQRPDIEVLVETDLQAIRTAVRWLKRYRPIGRRVDLDRLYQEFARTTRNELDFVAEGQNAERFDELFADDPGIRIPKIYAASSTRRVLIMEDVADIKIDDFAAIERAGVSRAEVARRLFDTYLEQVFVFNFVHADPHPGNLFVQPLPPLFGPLARPEDSGGAPFRLVFVDFGMVATMPQRVRPHLRDILLGFVTRDAGRVVRAYEGAGFLLPGADLERLEQVQAETLERYSGLTLRQVETLARSEWQDLARQYRDILYEMPFQLPSELLFVGRAIAILLGMATALDPDFDPWQAIEPFARQMAAEDAKRNWRSWLGEMEKATRVILSLPAQADRFLSQANRGELSVRSDWSPGAKRTLRRVEAAIDRLAAAVVFAALLLAAVAVHIALGQGVVSYSLFALAAVALLVMLTRR